MKPGNLDQLRSRLKQLTTIERPTPPPTAEDLATTALRKRLERMYGKQQAQIARVGRPEDAPPLELTRRYPLDHCHGRYPLASLLDVDPPGRAAELSGHDALLDFDPRRALYLDTETTGLESGTGTLVFLIGCGWFEDDAFVLHQELVRDFPDEPRALEAFATLLGRFDAIVTFNGKCFDVDRLKMRMTLKRIEHHLGDLPHLDLLFPARRLLGLALAAEGCSLQVLERHSLGVRRKDDISGKEAPERYFTWLNTGDDDHLRPILRHNRLDILSLVTLTAHLLERAADPVEMAADPLEAFSAARFLFQHSDREDADAQAIAGYERALEGSISTRVRHRARRDLSLILKGQGRITDAMTVWEEMANHRRRDPWPLEELAKAAEHHLRDLDAAERWTLRLLEVCRQHLPAQVADAEHRLARLQKKRRIKARKSDK